MERDVERPVDAPWAGFGSFGNRQVLELGGKCSDPSREVSGADRARDPLERGGFFLREPAGHDGSLEGSLGGVVTQANPRRAPISCGFIPIPPRCFKLTEWTSGAPPIDEWRFYG